ncbi:MAG: hypothetical protein ACJARP_001914 [Vicingaceae bacterium]|jgi:hypothetical protein
MIRRSLFCIILFYFGTHVALAQATPGEVVPSISELIFPGEPETKNNFNLFYEIHVDRDSIPQPSFWYKIIFNKECNFEFTLFPLMESDHYEFYLYKVVGNNFICDALSDTAIISLNDYKYIKNYDNSDQSAGFRASLIDIKPIPVNAGDAVYLEVIAVKGTDCGHIFDCRTSEGSVVVKVVNDNCNEVLAIEDSINELLADRKEELALQYLSELFCLEKREAIGFTSVSLVGESKSVKLNTNFHSYSKQEAVKYKPYQKLEPTEKTRFKEPKQVEVILPKLVTNAMSFTDSILQQRSLELDSLQEIYSQSFKSTATLNRVITAKETQTLYDAKQSNQPTRREVDRALFNLLLSDLKFRLETKREALKLASIAYKKIGKKNVSKRRPAYSAIKKIRVEKKAIELKISETKLKIRQIEKLISTGNELQQGGFAFDKSATVKEEEVVYRIQIGVYTNKISKEIFSGLSPVSEDPYEGGVRYSVGAFPKFDYAKQAKMHVVNIGLKDAFIVAYFNGKRVNINEALKLER